MSARDTQDETLVYLLARSEKERAALEDALGKGCALQHFSQSAPLLRAMAEKIPDVILAEAELATGPRGLLAAVRAAYPRLPVIVFSHEADVEAAVRAVKAGAYDFTPLPDGAPKLKEKILRAADEHRLLVRVDQLISAYERRGKFGDLVGISSTMQNLYATIESVAPTDATVFIIGESGTGKELIAKAIHNLSTRKDGWFVPVNCAAIPKDLLESELFGHEKGAFTGAESRRIGCCEQADGGTLFLDEICEMNFALQSKLLRFLQERSFHRVGGAGTIQVDTRVVAATNRDPLEEVERGKLRDDLYYRLHVVHLFVAPLRDHPEDIPVLAQHFLQELAEKYDRYFVDFSPEALIAMLCYEWPGNVRELLHAIEQIVVLAKTDRVTAELLPEHIRAAAGEVEVPPIEVPEAVQLAEGVRRKPPEEADEVVPISEMEKRAILSAIRICGGDISKAARKLGISRATLYRKLEKYGIR